MKITLEVPDNSRLVVVNVLYPDWDEIKMESTILRDPQKDELIGPPKEGVLQ